ncbi:MAG: acyl-CoA dehydrogenase family protein [Ectothiorhodospiraceae bacterium]|nr:acyl-CoA dehydrogenase family protein [Ectothiorhodospiraceae bacterium]MCH8503453.1 acyl-CoA dehydrogenase family protein [Ectothiorhodospiraceae bacterium]
MPAQEIEYRPFHTDRHTAFRCQLQAFIAREIAPYVDAWESERVFPASLRRKAAEVGVLGAGFPEEWGGIGGDIFDKLIVKEDLARFGAGGVRLGLTTHCIALPPIIAVGSDALRQRVLPPVFRGDAIAALAITEPDGGSDVANLTTTAERSGDSFVLNGEKTFISSGCSADFYTVAVRTGAAGVDGISLLLVEKGTSGFTQERQDLMGWRSWDNATLRFRDCRVPAENLIGAEGKGFRLLMQNFNEERLGNAAIMLGAAKACWEDARQYAGERVVFGRPLAANQTIRHKLVEMRSLIQAVQASLDVAALRFQQGETPIAEIAMTKNLAARTYEFCAAEAVQIHGARGLVTGERVERLFRESKILSIGGGATEVLNDLAARQLGL